MKLSIFILTLLFLSCSKSETDAEKTLKSFIHKRFEKELTRKDINTFTTGEMAKELNSMTDENFKVFAKKSDWEKNELKIRTQNCKDKVCIIVYTLKYAESKSEEKVFSTEVKKIAEIIKENSKWKINKIENVKTYLKSHREI